jgi:hypothetical protein
MVCSVKLGEADVGLIWNQISTVEWWYRRLRAPATTDSPA